MDPVVAAIRDALAERTDLACAWVFGSIARGSARADSDVDVAVLRGRARTGTLADIPDELAAVLESVTDRRVDIVIVDEADPELVHRVLCDGVLVAERDRGARIAFEVRKRNGYFDLMPHRLAYRKAVLARAKRGAA